jgi:hypothetical protein
MPQSEEVTKFGELAMCVLRGIRLPRAVMQMNLDFAPALTAVASQTLHERLVVLLGRIKVRMTKGAALLISIGVDELRTYPAPILKAPLLFVVRGSSTSVFGYDSRLEVIRYGNDQVH